jgi:hypothetical protein
VINFHVEDVGICPFDHIYMYVFNDFCCNCCVKIIMLSRIIILV